MSDAPRGRPPRGPARANARPSPKPPREAPPPRDDVPGLSPRRAAAHALDRTLARREPLDEALSASLARADPPLDPREARFARALALAAARRLGTLRGALAARLDSGVPAGAGRLEAVLLTAAAGMLFLGVPDHAAVDGAVRLAREDPRSSRYAGLANAVLRRLAERREEVLAEAAADPFRDTPAWLKLRWREAYGEEAAAAIAAAHAREPGLDLTVRGDPEAWAARVGGVVLPTGSVRLDARAPVPELPGYAEGGWWVQDAAAALAARLLAPAPGMRVLDLCAAPGGKTAQLASAGARVTAVDRSPARLARLARNLARLGLEAEAVAADGTSFEAPEPFDAVLLDAPCSATGTLRRHPDVAWTKREEDLAGLAALQARLLARAAALVRPGGRLVYGVCSLEPEEGEGQVAAFLAAHPGFAREPVTAAEVGGLAELLTPAGDLRTLPRHLPDPDPRRAGLDGFFAARLVRR